MMTAKKRRAILKEKKIKHKHIRAALNPPVSQSAISQVIAGNQTSDRIRKEFCKQTGISFEEAWC